MINKLVIDDLKTILFYDDLKQYLSNDKMNDFESKLNEKLKSLSCVSYNDC